VKDEGKQGAIQGKKGERIYPLRGGQKKDWWRQAFIQKGGGGARVPNGRDEVLRRRERALVTFGLRGKISKRVKRGRS